MDTSKETDPDRVDTEPDPISKKNKTAPDPTFEIHKDPDSQPWLFTLNRKILGV